MPKRTISLMLSTAAAACVLAAAPVQAGEKTRKSAAHDHYYAGPEFVRGIPGIRLLFGDYALTEEEFERLYGSRQEFDESYYEPEPLQPPKARKRAKPAVAARPSTRTASAPAGEPEPTEAQAGTEPPAATAKSAGGVSCDEARSIIAGYGFSAVKPESCDGTLYAFSAARGGKTFSISLDPARGELTDVKKLD